MRALLDTNVIFDLLTCRPPDGDEALKLLTMEQIGDIELWVSAKSFTDVFYVMRKDNKSEDIQNTFLKYFEYLHVCSLDLEDLKTAAERCWSDFEDCLIDVCAEKVQADVLLTRDKNGFVRSHVRTMSPKDLFAFMEEEFNLVYDVIEW